MSGASGSYIGEPGSYPGESGASGSYLGDSHSYPGETRSYIGDCHSGTGETASYLGDTGGVLDGVYSGDPVGVYAGADEVYGL